MWINHDTPFGTLKDKKNQLFNLKISLVLALSTFFYINPCTLVLVPDFYFFKKKHSMKLLCFIIVLFIIFIENNDKKNKIKKIFLKK